MCGEYLFVANENIDVVWNQRSLTELLSEDYLSDLLSKSEEKEEWMFYE